MKKMDSKERNTRDKIEKLWGGKVKRGDLSFQIAQDVLRPEQKLIFDKFPEEVLARVIQCYFKKYLIEAEVDFLVVTSEMALKLR